MSETTELATAPNTTAALPAITDPGTLKNPLAFLTDTAAFEHLWRIAAGYARSFLVPQQFQGKRDDCFIICQLALRLRVDPFMLMQSTYIVHGRPGFEAKFAIAMLNSSGKILGTIKTEFSGVGEDYGCRAWCIDRDTGLRIDGPKVDWKMVHAEGWHRDKGSSKSKWMTMPDLMFVYRAASYLIRTNYPEVLMGMQTKEELEDTAQQPTTITQLSNSDRLDLLLSAATETNPQPNSTIDVESAEATPDKVSECQPTKGDAQVSDQDAESIFAEFCDAISQCTTVDAVRNLQTQYADSFDATMSHKAQSKVEMRIADLQPTHKRGSRSNGSMFDKAASATEAGG